jgi:hypothetical protein
MLETGINKSDFALKELPKYGRGRLLFTRIAFCRRVEKSLELLGRSSDRSILCFTSQPAGLDPPFSDSSKLAAQPVRISTVTYKKLRSSAYSGTDSGLVLFYKWKINEMYSRRSWGSARCFGGKGTINCLYRRFYFVAFNIISSVSAENRLQLSTVTGRS